MASSFSYSLCDIFALRDHNIDGRLIEDLLLALSAMMISSLKVWHALK